MSLLRSAMYEPASFYFINTLYSSDPGDIEDQAALMIVKNAVQMQSFNYAFVEIPKQLLIDFLKKAAFILSLYGIGFEDVITKLEKESVKEAKKIIEEWLNENQIKIASGYIDKYDFYSYKGNKQDPNFGYNMIFKPKGGNSKTSEVFIEFYSPEFIEPPASRGHDLMWGNFWNEEDWKKLGKDRVQPFILRIKGEVKEAYNNSYDWSDGTNLEVVFNEPVPEVIIPSLADKIKEKIKEKINDYLSNPLFNINIFKAQISDSFEEEYGDEIFKLSDVYYKFDDLIESLENQCFDNTCHLEKTADNLNIQDILDDISEKIDILAQEIAKLTGKKADENNEESEEDDNNDDKKTYSSPGNEPNWCIRKENATPLGNKIIINEIAWMGTDNSSSDEWIEIKNISNEPVNLDGWQILDKNRQIKIYFDSKYEISSGGIMLLERTDENSVPYVLSNYIYSGALANSNESLEVFNSNCDLEDEAIADLDWPAGDASSKRTMERGKDLKWHNYSGLGKNGIMGTPKEENSEPGEPVIVSKILITEVQTAGKIDPKEEFVELYNPNDEEIDLTGWYLEKKTKSGTVSYFDKKALLFGKKISAKRYFLISRSGYFTDKADILVDAALSDDSTLILRSPAEAVSDKVGWGEAIDFESEPTDNPGNGESIGRKTDKGEYIDTDNNKLDFKRQNPSPKLENKTDDNLIWPVFQHDNRHTGRSEFSIGSNLGVSGIYDLASFASDCFSITKQPVVGNNGVIYLGIGQSNCAGISNWGKIISLNSDGTLKWEFSGLPYPASYISIGPDNVLYVSSLNNLYALNPDGTQKWVFKADSNISSSITDSNGFIYFTSYVNIYCLDNLGNQKWKSSGVYRGGSATNGPVIGQNGTIYVAWTGFRNMSDEQKGSIFAYDTLTGIEKWQSPLKYRAESPSIGENQDIYAMAEDIYNNDSRIRVTDKDGISKPDIYLGHGTLSVPVIDSNGTIIVYDNWSVIAGQSWSQPVYQPYSQVIAFNQDGTKLWSSGENASSFVNSQIFLDNAKTIIVSKTLYERYSIDIWSGWWFQAVKNILTGIDADSGSEKWQIDLPDKIISNFVLSDNGSIYFAVKENADSGVKIRLYNFGPGGEQIMIKKTMEISEDQELNDEFNLILNEFDLELEPEVDEEFYDEEDINFNEINEEQSNIEVENQTIIEEQPQESEDLIQQDEIINETLPEAEPEVTPEITPETIIPEIIPENIPIQETSL